MEKFTELLRNEEAQVGIHSFRGSRVELEMLCFCWSRCRCFLKRKATLQPCSHYQYRPVLNFIDTETMVADSTRRERFNVNGKHAACCFETYGRFTPPENDGLEDVSPFPGVYSQVPC